MTTTPTVHAARHLALDEAACWTDSAHNPSHDSPAIYNHMKEEHPA
jgi:hypothetical protein